MESKIRDFFKFMNPEFRTTLPLPPVISNIFVKKKAKQVTLITKKGSWNVKVEKCGGNLLWFTTGWNGFAQEHGLTCSQVLFFEHMGGWHFKTKLFDGTCVEKGFEEPEMSGERADEQNMSDEQEHPVKVEVDEYEVPIQEAKCSAKPQRDDRKPSPVKLEVEDENEVASQVNMQNLKKKKCSRKRRRSGEDDERMKLEVYENEARRYVKQEILRVCKAKGKPKRTEEPKVSSSSSEPSLEFKASMKDYNLRSRSPYFLIPANFVKAHGLHMYHGERITLIGPNAEQQVSLKFCKGGKTKYGIISRGWLEFIIGNNLNLGDECIFSLQSIGNSSYGIVFHVEVKRA